MPHSELAERTVLFGRATERADLGRLLDDVRAGHGGARVLRGEAGIGKSVLMEQFADQASDLRILRGAGIEFEAELAFAGLHLLLQPVLDRIPGLPGPQAEALCGALGLGGTHRAPGDRFLVAMAVLTVLSELSEDRPVLVLIDDAHWLDHGSAEALLFVARRLGTERIGIVFAARQWHAPEFPAPGVPELMLSALDDSAASDLLAAAADDLPGYVRDQIRGQSDGNPLALRELAAAQREGQLALDPFGVARLPTYSRIQRTFADRIAALPAATRTVMLIAAADNTTRLATVDAAARRLDVRITDLGAAEQRDLVRVDTESIHFRHPLIRAAAYQAAPVDRRIAVHKALADVLDADADADRRAWHLASAATGPDDETATALTRSAERARERGGYVAVAAGYERAAALSTESADRADRLLAAAEAAMDAGQLTRADTLAASAAARTDDVVRLGRAAKVRGTVASWRGDFTTATRLWTDAALSAARRAESDGLLPSESDTRTDLQRERDSRDDRTPTSQDTASFLLFQIAETGWISGDLAAVRNAAEVAGRYRLRRAYRVGAMARFTAGINGHRPGDVTDALTALRELRDSHGGGNPPPQSATTLLWWHLILGDHDTAYRVGGELVAELRSTGAVGVLPRALGLHARALLYRGEHRAAHAAAGQALRLGAEIGDNPLLRGFPAGILAQLAAIAGDEAECRRLIAEVSRPDDGAGLLVVDSILGMLDVGLGRYTEAFDRLTALMTRESRMDVLEYVPDLVEAAARLGRADAVTEPLAWYTEWAEQTGQDWAKAVALRCRALLEDASADALFIEAARLHAQPHGRPFETARTALVHGEWLRRNRQRNRARARLRAAYTEFERIGADPWARRAHTELRAAGESVDAPHRGPDRMSTLTAQEREVVRLAGKGLTNRDIGAQLFLSPRTVGYHLYKAYPKLGVASRAELRNLPGIDT